MVDALLAAEDATEATGDAAPNTNPVEALGEEADGRAEGVPGVEVGAALSMAPPPTPRPPNEIPAAAAAAGTGADAGTAGTAAAAGAGTVDELRKAGAGALTEASRPQLNVERDARACTEPAAVACCCCCCCC